MFAADVGGEHIGFSKDYDKKVRNTIFFPYYNWRNKLRYISVKSDFDGVCRLYGHRAYLSHEEKQLRFWNDGYAAVIAKSGMAVSVKRGEWESYKFYRMLLA